MLILFQDSVVSKEYGNIQTDKLGWEMICSSASFQIRQKNGTQHPAYIGTFNNFYNSMPSEKIS